MKTCKKCGVEKDVVEFYKNKSNKDGLRSCCKSCTKAYYKSNQDRIRAYYKANKDKKRDYYEANKEHIKAYQRIWEENNKEYLKAYRKTYKDKANERRRIRRKAEPLFKMICNLRNRTNIVFRRKGYKKSSKTQEMLGVDWEVCKTHIEKQFTEGMNWDNYGDWHIDHIIPLASAKNEEELMKLCHYKNLQPLWAKDNLKKSAKIQGQQTYFKL